MDFFACKFIRELQRHQKLAQCANSLQFEQIKWCEQQTLSECVLGTRIICLIKSHSEEWRSDTWISKKKKKKLTDTSMWEENRWKDRGRERGREQASKTMIKWIRSAHMPFIRFIILFLFLWCAGVFRYHRRCFRYVTKSGLNCFLDSTQPKRTCLSCVDIRKKKRFSLSVLLTRGVL